MCCRENDWIPHAWIEMGESSDFQKPVANYSSGGGKGTLCTESLESQNANRGKKCNTGYSKAMALSIDDTCRDKRINTTLGQKLQIKAVTKETVVSCLCVAAFTCNMTAFNLQHCKKTSMFSFCCCLCGLNVAQLLSRWYRWGTVDNRVPSWFPITYGGETLLSLDGRYNGL